MGLNMYSAMAWGRAWYMDPEMASVIPSDIASSMASDLASVQFIGTLFLKNSIFFQKGEIMAMKQYNLIVNCNHSPVCNPRLIPSLNQSLALINP